MNIFIIEDDFSWGTKIEMMVLNMGLKVMGRCNNLASSRDFLLSKTPDLVIADVLLEEEIVFDLFADNAYLNIPVIFITQSTEEIHYQKAKLLKQSHFLVKPFHQLTLQASIDLLMGRITPLMGANFPILVRNRYNEKINLAANEIIWIKKHRNYSFLKTDDYIYTLKKSLNIISKSLGDQFFQINKGCLVNKTRIETIDAPKKHLKVDNEVMLVGAKFRKEIINFLTIRIIGAK